MPKNGKLIYEGYSSNLIYCSSYRIYFDSNKLIGAGICKTHFDEKL